MRNTFRWLPLASMALLATLTQAQSNDLSLARAAEQNARNVLRSTPGLKQSPTRILVRYKSDTTASQKAQARAQSNSILVRSFRIVPGLEVLDNANGASQGITALRHNPHVAYAEFDYVLKPLTTPNDPKMINQWGLNDPGSYGINAPQAWSVFTGDPNFVIADIDTGMQLDHLDLAANLYHNPNEIPGNGIDDDNNGFVDDVNGWDFYDNDNDPSDTHGHGTHTAGIIGAVGNNGIGVTGVNWACKLMPLRFIGPNGGYNSDAIRALEYAVGMGVKISNNSWGGDAYDQSLADAIEAAKNAGHIFVAAAGNSASDNNTAPMYPASYANDNIISVAAIDSTGSLAYYSNFGSTTVDIAAPGDQIYSTYIGNTLTYLSGTSMAAPHVAGVAALLWASHPEMTWQQVKARILAKARPLPSLAGKCVSGGLVDAYATLSDQALPPAVSIGTPSNNAVVTQGAPVTLSGTASDGVDGNISNTITWTSDRQGSLGSGSPLTVTNLAAGFHKLTAMVTDSRGLTASSTILVTVRNSAPTVYVNAPTNGATVSQGGTVSFQGSATDQQDGDMTPQLVWISNLQGQLGMGGSFTRNDLVPGTHVITAQAVDSGNLVTNVTVTVNVLPAGGSAPTVSIVSPSAGSAFATGSAVTFTGAAQDAQDGNLGANISWNSSLMGSLGTGASFTRSDLVVGTHTITASVIDSSGLTNKTTITVVVQAQASTYPNAPSSPALTKGGGGLTVSWADNSNNETGFEIERQYKTGKNWSTPVTVAIVGANVKSFKDTPPAGTWRYHVRAVNSMGPSPWSAWTSAVKA